MMVSEATRFGSSPPRAWQTGERRSPPLEALEPRRRTRPRHSSLRGSGSPSSSAASNRPSLNAGTSPAASQQGPTDRERVTPPYFPAWAYFSNDPRRSLTTHAVRQYMPMPNHIPYGYHPSMGRGPGMPPLQPMEPSGLAPPSIPSTHPVFPPFTGPTDSQPYHIPTSGSAGTGGPSTDSGQLPGPAQMAAYGLPLPPVGVLEAPGFPGASNLNNGASGVGGEHWLQ